MRSEPPDSPDDAPEVYDPGICPECDTYTLTRSDWDGLSRCETCKGVFSMDVPDGGEYDWDAHREAREDR